MIEMLGACSNYVDKRGGGVAQMTTTLNNSYFSISVHIGGRGGVKIAQNSVTWFVHAPLCETKTCKYLGNFLCEFREASFIQQIETEDFFSNLSKNT